LAGKDARAVAAHLGHDLSNGGGVSVEPGVVVVHLPGVDGPQRIEHVITEE
jgi:hypothetical protein